MPPELKIRDVSPEVYARLQESARAHGRSMEAELRLIVATAVGASSTSLVLELREQALNPKIHITDLLRKVKVVAAKLDLIDILEWVTHELDGYPDDDSVIPAYREIRGVAKGFNPLRGWLKIQFPDTELEERVSTQKSRQPISEIEPLAEIEDGSLTFIASSALANGLSYATDARIFVSRSQITRILDAVRNRVLTWVLSLEQQGIMGEGMSFSTDEKVQATNSSFHFGNNYDVRGNVAVLGDVFESSVTQNTGSPMEPLANALRALSDLAARIDDPSAIAVSATAERAALAAASSQPSVPLIERLISGTSSVVQGIASLVPAWNAVTTEAAKLGLIVGLSGPHP